MSNTITCKILNEKIQLGALENTCFGCGQETDKSITLFYEDDNLMTFFHRLKSLMTRRKFRIPLCKKCSFSRYTLKLLILLWVIVFFITVGLIIYLIGNFDKMEEMWVRILVILIAVFPFLQIKKYWMQKDRGNDIVTLADIQDTEVTFTILNSDAYEKLTQRNQW